MYLGLCLVVAGMIGCSDDNNITGPGSDGKGRILTTITVGSSSYVGVVQDLTVGAITNTSSYEHADKAAPYVCGDMVFICEHWKGDVVYKYTRNTEGGLDPAGSITLPAGGNGQCMAFKDYSKAYVTLNRHGTVYVFNPTTLEPLGEIDLTQYGIDDSNPDPAGMVVRDGILFVALSQLITTYSAHAGGHVAVIDAEQDTVIKVISDDRVTSLGGSFNRSLFQDENGDIYLYSSGVWGYQADANDGILRIRNGETDFDPNYYFSPRSQTVEGLTGGSVLYGMTFVYGGNSRVYSTMLVPALTSNPPDYENDKNAQPVVLDLSAQTVSMVDIPASNMYASVGLERVDSLIVFGLSTVNGDGLYTYNLNSGEASQEPVVTTVGKPQFMSVFED